MDDENEHRAFDYKAGIIEGPPPGADLPDDGEVRVTRSDFGRTVNCITKIDNEKWVYFSIPASIAKAVAKTVQETLGMSGTKTS